MCPKLWYWRDLALLERKMVWYVRLSRRIARAVLTAWTEVDNEPFCFIQCALPCPATNTQCCYQVCTKNDPLENKGITSWAPQKSVASAFLNIDANLVFPQQHQFERARWYLKLIGTPMPCWNLLVSPRHRAHCRSEKRFLPRMIIVRGSSISWLSLRSLKSPNTGLFPL